MAAPLRIAFFNAADSGSGAEVLTMKTAEALIVHGHEARLFVMNRMTDAPYVYPFPRFFGERRAEQLFRTITGLNDVFFPSTLLLRQRPWIKEADLWHFHNLHGHFVSIPFLAAESRRRPIVLSPVDQFLSTGYCTYTLGCERYRRSCGACPQIGTPYPSISRDTTRRLLAMKAKAVKNSGFRLLVHTDYLAKHYASTFVGTRPIDHFYYGVDTKVFRPLARRECAVALGIKEPQKFAVGLFHSFVNESRKGFHPLLELLKAVAGKRSVRLEVLVVGSGSERTQQYATPEMQVTTLPFLKREEELAMALNLCDVLLYPTQADNLSLTCLNALACGVPVITSRVGGQPEAVEDGVNGFLCEPGSLDEILERVIDLATDCRLVSQFSLAARETAIQKFDINTYVVKLIGYYESVLQGHD